MAIAGLDKKTVKYLTTGQIITSVSTAVKELVENALDGQATNIDIKLDDNGISLIEVSDNGRGIAKIDTEFMALQSYTSKIKDFCDLDALQSYGFRGEALASLCRVADVIIITKTENDKAATSYTMNHDGTIKSSELCHRSVGTTVQARSLFKEIPVRRQIITNPKRSNQDVKTLETLLRSFAICQPNVRLSYRVNGSFIFTKPSTTTAKESLKYLFGNKYISQIHCIEHSSPVVSIQLYVPRKNAEDLLEICQAGSPYVFINQRPVTYKEIEKVVNLRLVQYFGDKIPQRKKPTFLLSLLVSADTIDVNLEPNKTSVLLLNKVKIIEILDKLLLDFYGIIANSEDSVQNNETASANDTTAEYHDYTIGETAPLPVPSTKKRKIENKSEKTNAVKVPARSVDTEKISKTVHIARKLFENHFQKVDRSNKENNNGHESSRINDTLETISQLPVVDLGEDFSSQEIFDLPNLDPLQIPTVLSNSSEEDPKIVPNAPDSASILTDEAWSKGQVPGKLLGGTDVEIYKNADSNIRPEVEATDAVSNSPADTGFKKFCKEIRPQVINENPGINFVQMAKILLARWKNVSPEEQGYYRDLAAADKASNKANDTSFGSSTSVKTRVSDVETKTNRKRFLNMLENMKNPKSNTSKRNNLMMRTVVPWTMNLETLSNSFIRKECNFKSMNKSIVLGQLNDNVWLARTGCQIWALSLTQLFDGLGLEKSKINEVTRESVDVLVQRWLHEKDDMSLLHPVFELE